MYQPDLAGFRTTIIQYLNDQRKKKKGSNGVGLEKEPADNIDYNVQGNINGVA